MKTEFYEILKNSKPNPSHEFVGYLQKKKKLKKCITQNIDDMHIRGGFYFFFFFKNY